MSAPRRALVTGASGYVGSHVAARLAAAGWEVHALLRAGSSTGRVPPAAHAHRFDGGTERLVEIVSAAAPDVVFHLASLFIAEHATADVTALIESNVLLGTQLAEAMRVQGCTRLVNTGTAWQHFGHEEYHPADLYAATKQAYVDVLRYFVEAAGLRVITLELFDTYGPDDPRSKLMTVLRRAALNGGRVGLTEGRQRLDLVHVDDVARAYEGAAQRLLAGAVHGLERWMVRTGEPVSVRELVALFERVTGRTLDAEWGARPYRARDMLEPWSGGETLPGWHPRVPLEQGIRALLAGAEAAR